MKITLLITMSPIKISLAVLAAVLTLSMAAAGAKIVSVSSLDISKATQGWGTPHSNQSVGGNPLTLDGKVFTSGFGTHAPGNLVIVLDGGTQRFTATVGVDDEVGGGKGDVIFEVLGDGGKCLWRSALMHQGDTPEQVDLTLAGVQRITLRLLTGDAGFAYCHADWADAMLEVSGALPQTAIFTPSVVPAVISMAVASAAPQFHPPFIVGIHPGTPLLWTVPVTGERPMTYIARGLPHGVRINAMTGTITGAAPTKGTYPVNIVARNSSGHASQTIRIVSGSVLALTPPMGWNSYDGYGDSVTESEILANAHYVQTHLLSYGYNSITVDYRWYDPGAHNNDANARAGAELSMDPYGRLLPAPNRFPSAANGAGFQSLAAKVHAMGLLFGIHIMRGIPRNAVLQNLPIQGSSYHAADAANTSSTCPWDADMYGVRGDTPAGQAYYDSLFRLYASWGVDFVKMDDTSSPYYTDEIHAVDHAIAKCGRSIVLSLSPGPTPIADAADVESHANSWRIANDFWDSWVPGPGVGLDVMFALDKAWEPWRGPGHWPDSDMLPVGHLSVDGRSVGPDRQSSLTRPEQMTLMTLWALQPAPLIIGAALPGTDPWTLALLSNPEVLAVDQDALGASAKMAWTSGDGYEAWIKRLSGGRWVVGLFNRQDWAGAATVSWADLGVPGHWDVRDLWLRKDLGKHSQEFKATIPAHGAFFLLLTPENKGH